MQPVARRELASPDAGYAAGSDGAATDRPEAPKTPGLPSPAGAMSEDPPDPVARLRRLIEEREEETVEILRSWMEEDEELT